MNFFKKALPHTAAPPSSSLPSNLQNPDDTNTTQTGLVVSTSGRHILVQKSRQDKEDKKNTLVVCHPRGKKNQALVGDQVYWRSTGDGGVVEKICPRRNVFFRQDATRIKSFAANIDHILFCIAAEPVFSERQLARALIAAKAQNIPIFIVLNKSDLHQAFTQAWQRLASYRDMAYPVLPLTLKPSKSELTPSSAKERQDLTTLAGALQGKSSLILGPSGVGKSSLINRLIPNAKILTQAISQALGTGKHTTTATSWHWALTLDENTALIDSPGFQEFGLYHLKAQALASYMPDIAKYQENCRFYNCSHLHEPGCEVRTAVGKAQITASRYAIYEALYQELSQPRY